MKKSAMLCSARRRQGTRAPGGPPKTSPREGLKKSDLEDFDLPQRGDGEALPLVVRVVLRADGKKGADEGGGGRTVALAKGRGGAGFGPYSLMLNAQSLALRDLSHAPRCPA